MNASQISKWLCDQVILKSEKRDKKGRNTIKWIQPHIIKWMLRGGLRTAELITSSGVRRDVNNSVFVAGIKTDTRLDMEPREWTRSQATKTQLSPPRDGAMVKSQDLRFPAPSTQAISLLRQEQETCQHWEDKKVNNRRGKSQHVEIWDGASVTSVPIVTGRQCLIILGVRTSQTSIVRYSDTVRKQLSSERRGWPE